MSINPLRVVIAGLLALLSARASAAELSIELDPEVLRQMRQQAETHVAPLLRNAILSSRQEALAAGTQPIPPAIRARLKGHYPEALLDSVRWRAGGGSEVSLQLNVIQYGDRSAITLNEVVVFARAADAQSNAALWVHELCHVDQFRRWGVDGFAARYVHDFRGVEAEAERAEASYSAWLTRSRAAAP